MKPQRWCSLAALLVAFGCDNAAGEPHGPSSVGARDASESAPAIHPVARDGEAAEAPVPASARWNSEPGWRFGKSLVAASSGSEAAIVYPELTAEGQDTRWRLMLQRLDAAGARRGTAVRLDGGGSGFYRRPALATDGNRYLACWELAAQISCAQVRADQEAASPTFRVAGTAPALAFGSGLWVLTYVDVLRQVILQRVSDDGVATGSPRAMGVVSNSADTAMPLLAATKSGFVLVAAATTTMMVHRLDGGFHPLAAPVDLGVDFWFFASVAVSGTTVVVNGAAPYGSNLFVIEGSRVAARFSMRGGGKDGLHVALVADGSSIAAAWIDSGSLVATRGQPVRYSVIESASNPSVNSRQVLYGPHDAVALIPMGDRLLVAATVGEDQILVAPVRRP